MSWNFSAILHHVMCRGKCISTYTVSYSSTTMCQYWAIVNLLSSILTILLTCPNNDTLLCYSNDPFLTMIYCHLLRRCPNSEGNGSLVPRLTLVLTRKYVWEQLTRFCKNSVLSILEFVCTNEIAVCIIRVQLYKYLAARLSNVPRIASSLGTAAVIDQPPAALGKLRDLAG